MARKGPLRKVVSDFWDSPLGIPQHFERLECGHAQRILTDIYGETNAYRRRCKKCAASRNTSHTGKRR